MMGGAFVIVNRKTGQIETSCFRIPNRGVGADHSTVAEAETVVFEARAAIIMEAGRTARATGTIDETTTTAGGGIAISAEGVLTRAATRAAAGAAAAPVDPTTRAATGATATGAAAGAAAAAATRAAAGAATAVEGAAESTTGGAAVNVAIFTDHQSVVKQSQNMSLVRIRRLVSGSKHPSQTPYERWQH
jgi:hypothetical protein